MSITKTHAGLLDGTEVSLYTLDNGAGLSAEIFDFGGIIRSLKIAGRDVVLGRSSLNDYLDNDGYLGAAIGRHANRIKNSCFCLNTKQYTVGTNDGGNSLHGGKIGFDKRVWRAEIKEEKEPSLVLYLESPDGDEGFPGNLSLRMTYTLTSENSLKIRYEAVCDRDTVFNPTNHSYFNLDGHSSGSIHGHTLQINADFYTPNTDECIPNGEILSVSDTPFDFTAPKKLASDIDADDIQLNMFGGYDHNFVIRGRGFRKAAVLTSSDEKLSMEVYTDMPGMQVYSANCLKPGSYKDGAAYGKHAAVCLETQFFPNSMGYSHFIPAILKKKEHFNSVTEYKFIQN